jgi:hypothetical protein
MHILKAKNIIKNHKRAMLDFIAHFDQDVFDVPSGPEGLVPAIYCLKTDNMFLFNGMIWKQSIFRCMFWAHYRALDSHFDSQIHFRQEYYGLLLQQAPATIHYRTAVTSVN